MAVTDDFFGTLMLGLDPYGAQKSGQMGPLPAQQRPRMNSNMSPQANMAVTAGKVSGTPDPTPKLPIVDNPWWRQMRNQQRAGIRPGDPGYVTPPGQGWSAQYGWAPYTGAVNEWGKPIGPESWGYPAQGSTTPNQTPNPGNPGGGGYPPSPYPYPYPGTGGGDLPYPGGPLTNVGNIYGPANIPSDIVQLRAQLAGWLQGNFDQSGVTGYNGPLTVGDSPAMNYAGGANATGFGEGMNLLQKGNYGASQVFDQANSVPGNMMDMIQQLLNSAQQTPGAVDPFTQGGSDTLKNTLPWLQQFMNPSATAGFMAPGQQYTQAGGSAVDQARRMFGALGNPGALQQLLGGSGSPFLNTGAGNVGTSVDAFKQFLSAMPTTAGDPYLQQGSRTLDTTNALFQQLASAPANTAGMPYLNQGTSTLDSLNAMLRQFAGAATPTAGAPYLSGAAGPLSDLQRTGGAPDITSALASIKTSGMQDIEDQMAQIREEYGQMGLGRGSDVTEALARGSSRGIAQINEKQSALAAQILNDAAQRRLGATSLAPTFSTTAQAPEEQALQRLLQGATALQGSASMAPTFATTAQGPQDQAFARMLQAITGMQQGASMAPAFATTAQAPVESAQARALQAAGGIQSAGALAPSFAGAANAPGAGVLQGLLQAAGGVQQGAGYAPGLTSAAGAPATNALQQMLQAITGMQTAGAGQAPFGNLALGARTAATGGMNDATTQMLNTLLGSLSASSNAVGMFPGMAGTAGQLGTGAAGQYLGQATTQQALDTQNLNAMYQEFIRSTTPSYPVLNQAVGMATGYPPSEPVIQGGGGMGSAIIGALGSLAGALPWATMFASSRTLKERIVPVEGTVAAKLSTLPIYKWSYKGDKTRHLGPMAEEFRDTFGVGDGMTLHPIDLFGVMLASMKDVVAHA